VNRIPVHLEHAVLGALILAPVAVAPLAWRIGMTAPAGSFNCWGRFSFRSRETELE
jgi:hypothetical protein